jgi:hypothetical protein
MEEHYSKKDTVEIIKRALTVKDREAEEQEMKFSTSDLVKMAGEFGIPDADLKKALVEINQTKEQNRDDLFPEVVTSKWISGRLTLEQIESFFSELKLEFGGSYVWSGKPAEIHKMGNTREYQLKNARITLTDKGDGYRLRIIKQQFFHGNSLEAGLLSIPAAFIVGLLPVAAAAEWLNIFAALITGTVLYSVVFFMIQKYIRNKREDTVSELLRISDFAEMKLKEMNDPEIIYKEEGSGEINDHLKFMQQEENKLRS